MTRTILTFLLTISACFCFGQPVTELPLKTRLDSLAVAEIPQLNEPVDISLTNIPLSELVRAVANHVGLNINIDPSLSMQVNNNYSGVKAKDILYMLCTEYKLNCGIYGNIITLKKQPTNNSFISVEFNKDQGLLSYEVKNQPLENFTNEVTRQSGYNFFLMNGTGPIRLNGFAKDLDPFDALVGLGQSNGFVVSKEKEKIFIIEPLIKSNGRNSQSSMNSRLDNQVKIDDQHMITVSGNNLSCNQLFQTVSTKLKVPFQQLTQLEGQKTLSLDKVDYPTFLNTLVTGTKQTYKMQDGVVFLGNRGQKELKTNRIVKFLYRRVDSLSMMLPKNIFPQVEIKEFSELNSLIISGDADVLDDAEKKLKELDVSVPVVLIDVMIVDVKNSEELETGLEAGIARGDQKIEKGGKINPGIDYTMDASSINNAISSLGLTKLGKVTPNFYVKIKALEKNGVVDVKSTPQLSTLNGHPANLSIGETQYYEEKRNVYQGSLNPQLEALVTFKPVEAQLGVIIEPFVTGNGDVTLTVEVEQSNFTDRFKDDAPPGLISRKFESMIRVKNQEMVLLGGLEELQKERTRSGLPGIAKVPVLSWLFTNRTSKNNKSRLTIFIKPTILY
ncbi:type II and III secretion system protein [Puteibacter caeruleilacunae]|nr:type II and III secretion system protein [Puteibacter caeruleilacunae]